MCKYQSPSLYYPCGCDKGHSRKDRNQSYYKDYYKDDVRSYRPTKYDYYSDEKKYDDYYDSFYEKVESSYFRRRCNCSYCRHKRRKKEKRFICHCRPY